MYFDLFKISRVMLYILKIIVKCLPVANFQRVSKSVSCHTHRICGANFEQDWGQHDKERLFLRAFKQISILLPLGKSRKQKSEFFWGG